MKLSRTFFGLIVTFAGLLMTVASLVAFGWAWIDRQGQVALMFDSALGPSLVAVFIAGVVTTLAGVIGLIVLMGGTPPHK